MIEKCKNCSKIPQDHNNCDSDKCKCMNLDCSKNREKDFGVDYGEIIETHHHAFTIQLVPTEEFLKKHIVGNEYASGKYNNSVQTSFRETVGDLIKEAVKDISTNSMLYWNSFHLIEGVQCTYNLNYFHIAEKPVLFDGKVACRPCVELKVKEWEREEHNSD